MPTLSAPLRPLPHPQEIQDDVLNHWVQKRDILRSIVECIEVPALCGELITIESQGGGDTAASGSRICPACRAALTRYELNTKATPGGLPSSRGSDPNPTTAK